MMWGDDCFLLRLPVLDLSGLAGCPKKKLHNPEIAKATAVFWSIPLDFQWQFQRNEAC